MKKEIAQKIADAYQQMQKEKEVIILIRRDLVQGAKALSEARYDFLCDGFRRIYRDEQYPNAHSEFFRRTITNDERPGHPKDFQECLRFVKTFIEEKARVHNALCDADTGLHGDGYTDLIDALAVAPQKIVGALCKSPERFDSIRKSSKKEIGWVFEEEMFNHMFFGEALETFLPIVAHKELGIQ